MPLMRCAECEGELSSEAPVCPHCGLVYRRTSVFGVVVKVILALVGLGIIFSLGSCVLCAGFARLGR
jgi:hypothetical protein